jgi:hypothetical protein
MPGKAENGSAMVELFEPASRLTTAIVQARAFSTIRLVTGNRVIDSTAAGLEL